MTEASDVLPPGTRLEEFEIERYLNAGGFGVTYLARDLSLDARRVVKEYLPVSWGARRRDGTVGPRTGADEKDYEWGLNRFIDEARMLARFKHPNIVHVYQVIEAWGTAYMVMEHVEGRTLRAEVESTGLLSEARARDLLEGLTDGLSAVHEEGMLHRDIKPENVMVRPDGTAVLIDFGSARYATGSRSRALTKVLTEGYAPFEQHQGRNQGPWTDIYSLGAVAYWALSGREPDVATVRVEDDRLPPLSSSAPGRVSAVLGSAVDAALRVLRQDRPQTVDDWRRLLRAKSEEKKPGVRWWQAVAAVLGLAATGWLAAEWNGRVREGEDRPDAATSTAAALPAAGAIPPEAVEARAEAPEAVSAESLAPSRDPASSTAAATPPVVAIPGEAGEEREERSGESPSPLPAAVEAQLDLDRSARREIQEGLRASGLDPGAADGLFGPGTRSALREWQSSRGMPATGYLDPPTVSALRGAAEEAARVEAERAAEAQRQAELEAQRQAELEAQRQAEREAEARRPGRVFRDCAACPEMVVLAGGGLALGRYEVTVGEYRAFVSATGGTGSDRWRDYHDSFRQTDRHPVVLVSWDDARAYVSWLSQTTGATYRLPTEAEWARAASGSEPGCDRLGMGSLPDGTCPVGGHGANAAGLSDMVGNVWEWTSDCWEGNCGRRVVRGDSWHHNAENLRPGARDGFSAGYRSNSIGFRVSRTLD